MNRREALLNRLDEIGRSLDRTGQALALLGLGSVGKELYRLDEYSDLDFFVIAKDGLKPRFLQDLDWLDSICPLAFSFKNTDDGYKALFEDRIFCEFAVFEIGQLPKVSYTAGRIVWKSEEMEETLAVAGLGSKSERRSTEWIVGEALTNLYVGLCRYRRGEKLSAFRFIQGYAIDRIIELSELIENQVPGNIDPFSMERRYEDRFPIISRELNQFIQGYDRSVESARSILKFLESHFQVNSSMKRAILSLCEDIK
jgi:lincosamide nucleotidyltransferase B/F